tara:strand:- start:73677 stop:74264 length:588 start_codon:yes stop_codon:yes gene_type:complete
MYEFLSEEKLEKLYPILNTEAEMIVNFVSCDGSMGYKLSAAIAAKYPDIKYKFQASCMNDEVKKGKITIVKKVFPFILHLPFKDSVKEKPTYEHLREGFEKLEFAYTTEKIIVNKIAIQRGIVPDDLLDRALEGLTLPEIVFYEEYDYYKELEEQTRRREEEDKKRFLEEKAAEKERKETEKAAKKAEKENFKKS